MDLLRWARLAGIHGRGSSSARGAPRPRAAAARDRPSRRRPGSTRCSSTACCRSVVMSMSQGNASHSSSSRAVRPGIPQRSKNRKWNVRLAAADATGISGEVRGLHRVRELVRAREIETGEAPRRACEGIRLDQPARDVDRLHVRDVERRDGHALVRLAHDQPLGRELAQRLADRSDAHVQLSGDVVLVDAGTARDRPAEDELPELGDDAILLRGACGDLRHSEPSLGISSTAQ